MINNDQLYECGNIPKDKLADIRGYFERLPADQYAEDRLRSRRYSRYSLSQDGTLEERSQKDFMQSKEINSFVGDVERRYEPIEQDMLSEAAFVEMFKEFRARTGISEDSIIEAHQMRWHCRRNIKIPAPEGNHQDGFDYISIFLVNAHNVDGGEIMLFPGENKAPCFKTQLKPGEFVVLDDRKLFHNAAPLVPTANDEDGYWDVIVLTANDAARNMVQDS